MKRLGLAAGLALIFHGLLFSIQADWLIQEPVMTREQRALSMTMSYRSPLKPLPEPGPEPYAQEMARPENDPSPVIPERPVTAVAPSPSLPSRAKTAAEETQPVLQESPQPGPLEEEADSDPGYPARRDRPADGDVSLFRDVPVDDAGTDLIKPQKTVYPRAYEDIPRPEYPGLARRRGYEGVVMIEVFVSRQGEVLEVKVLQTSGHALLDEEAKRTVKKYRFEPGREDGENVDMWVKIPVRFQLQN